MGKLFLVSTPIGNLEDISYRAIRTLKEVDMVAAEDTRRTGILLKKFDIKKPMISYHKFNEKKQVEKIITHLQEGNEVALVSDAGTPAISDPGYILVEKVIAEGFEVSAIPGPCAFISALAMSGLDTTSFTFFGFMPKQKGRKNEFIKEMLEHNKTSVFYQSPHDFSDTLEQIYKLQPNKKIVVVREITKVFEERKDGTAEELLAYFCNGIKGEITMLLPKAEKKKPKLEEGAVMVKELVDDGRFLKEACKEVALNTGLSQRDLYQHYIKK
ncbi:16S rRNA (cytidine(1402)-2'-O)-methyltransferase [Proteinivorax hydrogeniformans]|uniref:Ribosomal RNA small subunit methyltransferase I n=1 Tax=Proteinivorax hydrogeniformans TaxID=1826727 RepID=A0AAU8HT78_9FIRM